MDHNGVLTADDNVNAVQKRKGVGRVNGKDTMVAAEGGIANRSERDESEESPLLSDASGRSSPPPYDDDDDDGGVDYTKPSYTDWDHLPWWKKPSVCCLL
jgi:hypothetical protein